MSQHDMMQSVGDLNQKVFDHHKAKDCLMTMGETSENVAEKFGITREEQDRMGVESQAKAIKAQKAGKFQEEIVPVTIVVDGKEKVISQDDGPRETSLANLQK